MFFCLVVDVSAADTIRTLYYTIVQAITTQYTEAAASAIADFAGDGHGATILLLHRIMSKRVCL